MCLLNPTHSQIDSCYCWLLVIVFVIVDMGCDTVFAIIKININIYISINPSLQVDIINCDGWQCDCPCPGNQIGRTYVWDMDVEEPSLIKHTLLSHPKVCTIWLEFIFLWHYPKMVSRIFWTKKPFPHDLMNIY